ncbi:MAG TPA: hypothetical protein HPP56_01290 [Nitrospirae bacterium]|nr:hypothetical protein [Nitrospirota bacterium]
MIDEEHLLHIAKGELEVAMMKKADLNKNVSESVRQYVEMEGELMHRLIDLAREVKSGADARRILAIEGEINRLIASLDLLVMMSPALKSKGPYKYQMDVLKSNEDEVLSAIQKYNAKASEFNMFIYKIPYNIVAWIYDFKKAELFKAKALNLNSPDVERFGI